MFEDVWFVDGLKANLVSISQIYDNGLNVLFTKYERYKMMEVTTYVLE